MWFRNILLFNSLQVLSGWACVTCRNGDTIDGVSSALETPSLQYFFMPCGLLTAYASAGTFNGDSLEGVGRIMLYTNLSRSFSRAF
jgi:hypothetical protein